MMLHSHVKQCSHTLKPEGGDDRPPESHKNMAETGQVRTGTCGRVELSQADELLTAENL